MRAQTADLPSQSMAARFYQLSYETPAAQTKNLFHQSQPLPPPNALVSTRCERQPSETNERTLEQRGKTVRTTDEDIPRTRHAIPRLKNEPTPLRSACDGARDSLPPKRVRPVACSQKHWQLLLSSGERGGTSVGLDNERDEGAM